MFKLLLSLGWAISMHAGPLFYIYDLPEKYHNHSRYGGDVSAPGCFYSLDAIFPKLLRASPYVTTQPDEADYFYVSPFA